MPQEMSAVIIALAMSGLLPFAIFLLILLVITIIVITIILSKIKIDRALATRPLEKNDEYKKMRTYYDPSYPKRICTNCKEEIEEGQVYCFNCQHLELK